MAWRYARGGFALSGVVFTIDLEDWFHAITPPETWMAHRWRLFETHAWLLKLLRRHRIRATVYMLGWVVEQNGVILRDYLSAGHRIGSHGYLHRHGERQGDGSDFLTRAALHRASHRWDHSMSTHDLPYRAPFWETTPRPFLTGGLFFRALPYPLLKRCVLSTSVFALHPHDLDPGHPRFAYVPWRRYLGLDTARTRLERLVEEVQFV